MKRAIALGTFDGVHIGHRAIINAAIDRAAKLDMEPMIYTFTAHPMALFGKQPPLLMTQSERMAALGAWAARSTRMNSAPSMQRPSQSSS